MPLHDFYVERRTLRREGRRYTCFKPRVITLHMLLGLFDQEILGLFRAREAGLMPEGADLVELCLPVFLQPDPRRRIHRVLKTCVEVDGEDIDDELRLDIVKELLVALLSLTDIKRILASIPLQEAAESPAPTEEDAGEAIQSQVWVAGLIAQAFGLSFEEVLQLPYEAFLTIVEDLPALLPNVKPGRRQSQSDEPASADKLESLGLPVTRVES